MLRKVSNGHGASRIGVVLSSGGVLGVYAHTGFLQAMQRLRIPITASAGYSAGALVGGFTNSEHGRARRLAFVAMSSIAGFLLGPMLGVFVTRFAEDVFTLAMPAGLVAIPLAATALLVFIVAPAVALAVPSGQGRDQPKKTRNSTRSQFGLSFMRMALTVARRSA